MYSGIPQGTSHSLPPTKAISSFLFTKGTVRYPPSWPCQLRAIYFYFPHLGLFLVVPCLCRTTLSFVISHILAVLPFATCPYLISPSPLCSYSSNTDHTHLLQFCYFLLTLILLYRLNYKILNCLFYILTLISF